MKKKTKGLLIGAGAIAFSTAVVGAAALVSRKISSFVVNTALDRQGPKPLKGTKNPNDKVVPDELKEELHELTEKLKNSELETVTITAQDGEKLVGHWHHKEDDKRVIIAMHGWRSSWSHDFGAIADFWQDNGCSVLYVEQRGQGESGGEYMGFGMIEHYDCLEWIKWVNAKTVRHI